MSCTCCSVRLLTGLDGLVISTRPSHATGVKVRPLSTELPELPRAVPAISAAPLATASKPDAVLNCWISMLPWPADCQAFAIPLTTPLAVTASPRQVSDCVAAASTTVEIPALIRATESRRVMRTGIRRRDLQSGEVEQV